jgi:hypothetical protein
LGLLPQLEPSLRAARVTLSSFFTTRLEKIMMATAMMMPIMGG